jgi:two-component sensor histidine kinase/putative methionine-R-sulfoxide reductase with GAF domain
MNRALTEREALSEALRHVLPVLHVDSGKIYLRNAETGQLELVAVEGDLTLFDPAETTITPGQCLCGLALETGFPMRTRDLALEPLAARQGCIRHGAHACAAVPLLAKDSTLGILHIASRKDTAFADGDMALLRSVGAQMAVAVENMRLREEARRAEALATLIQEMHHRIKNNLQTVADLLSLEMSSSPSPAARKSLRDSVARIKSIAAVHELLSVEQLRLTDITELARQVCEISLRQFVRPDRRIEADVSGGSIFLPSKQATALALVMNELIANSLEHAFTFNGRNGRLDIALAQEGPQVTVAISDNGRGLPPDFDLNNARGLGLRIARTLAEKDLAGKLQLENRPEGGVRATLIFYK